MDWKKLIEKAIKGGLTALAAVIISSQEVLIEMIVGVLPEWIDPQMTIAAFIGAIIVGVSNYLKHAGE